MREVIRRNCKSLVQNYDARSESRLQAQATGLIDYWPYSISNLERRAILGPRAAVIVDPRGGDIRMAEPFLHFCDVGLVIERIGGG